MPAHVLSLTCVLWVFGLAAAAGAAEYYVGPDGKPGAAGTKEDPWDLTSTLAGAHKVVQGGDTIWVTAGKYRHAKSYERTKDGKGFVGRGFDVSLAGTPEKALVVRAAPGERATLDGGMTVGGATNYLWLQDLEITVTPDEDIPAEMTTRGSHPGDVKAPLGGLTILSGKDCKFINLYIHHNYGGGVGWSAANSRQYDEPIEAVVAPSPLRL